MNNCETLIRDIERIMINPDQAPLPQLKTLAVQYATQCKELNDSLVTILNDIYSCNYGEAIRSVEAQHILEDYNILNFPGLSDWKQVCATLNLAKPVELAEDLAERINELYDTQTPLLPYHKLHRKLSISRAPLRDRLKVLYKIDSMEPTNLNWGEMITKLEAKRDEELQLEYNEVVRTNGDPKAIQDIYAELTNPRRKSPQPQELFVKIKSRMNTIKRDNLMQSYRLMGKLLTKAYQEMDYPSAMEHLTTIQDSLKRDGLSLSDIPDDVRQEITAPLTWIKEMKNQAAKEEDFQMQIARMKQALENNADVDKLRRIYNSLTFSAETAQLPIPDSITYTFQKRIRSEESQKTRALILKIFLIVTLCLLVAGSVTFFVIWHNIKNATKHLVAEINTQIEQVEKGCSGNAVQTARKFIDSKKISPKTRKKPEVNDALNKLTSAAQEADSKYQKFIETEQAYTDSLDVLESKYDSLYEKFDNEEVDDQMREFLLGLIDAFESHAENSEEWIQTMNNNSSESDKEKIDKIKGRDERLAKKISQLFCMGKESRSVYRCLLEEAEREINLPPEERKNIKDDLTCLMKLEGITHRKVVIPVFKTRREALTKKLEKEKKD